MLKVLVTGGLGFIGSHTVVELHEAGYQPVILDNLANSSDRVLQQVESIIGSEVRFCKGDCRDVEAVRGVIESEGPFAGVIHFAAYKSVSDSVEGPLEYYENNIGSLVTILKACLDNGIENFIFSSSCTVYGQPDTLPVTENTPIQNAESPYGSTKIMGETIISDVSKSLTQPDSDATFKAMSLRYFNPIGAHPSARIGELPLGTPTNLVPYITQTAAGIRQQLTVHGDNYETPDGTCIRDYIHVVDLAKAHVCALSYLEKQAERVIHEYVNVGIGEGKSVLQIIEAFESATGQKLKYRIGPRRPGDIEKIYADVTRSGQLLNWRAQESIENALLHAWNWQKTLGDSADQADLR